MAPRLEGSARGLPRDFAGVNRSLAGRDGLGAVARRELRHSGDEGGHGGEGAGEVERALRAVLIAEDARYGWGQGTEEAGGVDKGRGGGEELLAGLLHGGRGEDGLNREDEKAQQQDDDGHLRLAVRQGDERQDKGEGHERGQDHGFVPEPV